MRQRFSDYNHKLNSMFQLISAMADELNGLKGKTNNIVVNEEKNTVDNSELMKLIVSDDDSEESDSDSDSDESNTEELDTIDYNNCVTTDDNVVLSNVLIDTNLEKANETNTLTINNNLEQVVLEEVSQDIASGTTNKDDIKLIELTATTDDLDDTDVNKMTVKQLKDLLTQKGLVFEQTAKKKDLIKLLEESNN